jgi:predicted DNA-binding protein
MAGTTRPETESRLTELASKSGRATDDLVEDALAGYLTEVVEIREMLLQSLLSPHHTRW